MKPPSRHPTEPSRFLLLFPLFSLIFHITLFFLLQSLSGGQHQGGIKEDEIIAMVDLESLKLPEVNEEKALVLPLPVPEKAPDSEPESITDAPTSLIESDIRSSLSQGIGLPGPEGISGGIEDPGLETSSAPILEEPPFNESDFLPEEAVLSEPGPEEAFQDPEESVTEPEPFTEEASLEPETEESFSPEPESAAEASPSEPEPAEETLALADETAPGPDTGSDAAPEGLPGEGDSGSSGEEFPSDSEEAAESDFPAGPGAEPSEEGLFSSAQKNLKEDKVTPPSPKKPSKAKIKKVGLLGLLGGGGGSQRGGGKGRLLVAKNSLREKTRSSTKEVRFPHQSLKATQKAAGLRKKVVSSEKKRLMRRRPTGRRRRSSGIKIVHGSGRNYGIISSAIRQKKGRLTNVYNRLLQNYENLQGNLIIEFVISPEGRVIKSQVLTSSLGNPSFEKALIKEIRRWKFPSVKTGQTTVLYPLSFFPSS